MGARLAPLAQFLSINLIEMNKFRLAFPFWQELSSSILFSIDISIDIFIFFVCINYLMLAQFLRTNQICRLITKIEWNIRKMTINPHVM